MNDPSWKTGEMKKEEIKKGTKKLVSNSDDRKEPIKKNFYKLIDTFTTAGTFRFEAVSYHYTLKDRHNFLNNNHNILIY